MALVLQESPAYSGHGEGQFYNTVEYTLTNALRTWGKRDKFRLEKSEKSRGGSYPELRQLPIWKADTASQQRGRGWGLKT